MIHAWSDGKGGQRIEDTGPLTRARMPTVDLEIYDAANKFIDIAVTGKKPFFVWFNTTRMHVWTHLKPSAEGRTGISVYADGMVEHDDMVGGLLKRLDELGIADNTIVVYGTDNGAEEVTWPDRSDARRREAPVTRHREARRALYPGTITAIEPDTRRVTTDAGVHDADVLVVALGADYDFDATPGLADGGNEFYTEAGAALLAEIVPTFSEGSVYGEAVQAAIDVVLDAAGRSDFNTENMPSLRKH